MEPKSKVYINPNFKGIPHTYTLEESKTTYYNKYYSKEEPQKHVCQSDDANKRRIYVNPNFIAVNNTYNGNGVHSTDYTRNYNSTIHLNQKVTNTQCFVNKEIKRPQNYGMLQNPIYSDTRFLENSETNKQNIKPEVSLPVNNFQQAPLSKSRYCIVRKKNETQTTSNISLSLNSSIQVPLNKVKLFIPQNRGHTYSSVGNSTANKNPINQKLCNTPQKVTKIKVSKYKTIPINYLKSNSQILTNKTKSSSIQFSNVQSKNGRLNSSLLASFNKNRFKFVKSKTLVNSIDIKPVLKTNQFKVKKNISLNKSKNIKAKFKINNIPCRLFNKYGKCLRKDYGKCEYLHDKKHVSLCRKFLKGICHDKQCTLSHELSAKKMPTCYFYLKGMCTKDNCPYLHIKLSDTTKICQDFIKGYCEKGDKCPFRHIKKQEIKNDKCKSNMSRNHKRITKNKNVQIKLNKIYKLDNKIELQEKCESDLRYYDSVKNDSGCQTIDSGCQIIKPTRCKLGTLPSFIQL